jgi:hypothetical protein
LVNRDDPYVSQAQAPNNDQGFLFGGGGGPTGRWIGRNYYPDQGWQSQPQAPQPSRGIFGLFQPRPAPPQPQPNRDYFWGGRVN